MVWDQSGSVSGWFWVGSGSVLGRCWVGLWFWVGFGSVLGRFWVGRGSLLGRFGIFYFGWKSVWDRFCHHILGVSKSYGGGGPNTYVRFIILCEFIGELPFIIG